VRVNEGLAHLSNNLFFVAVLCYAVAMLGYAGEFAFGRRARTAGAAGRVEGRLGNTALLSGRAAAAITVVGWAAHVGSVTTRGLAAHRVPWGNMYEFSSMIALIVVTCFLFAMTRYEIRYLGAFLMVPVVLYLGLAGTVLYAAAGPLMPALQSYWLKIHVVAAIVATGIFMCGAVASALYLVRERYERQILAAATIGPGAASATELRGVDRPVVSDGSDGSEGTDRTGGPDAPPARGSRTGLVARLPSADALDRAQHRIIAFAFPIWTFAIVAGAIWAESAWGRYWGWDPKETWSFITWVVYAGYLHARATAGWKGRRAATVALIGFACLFIDFYVVNTLIVGLHSYAGIS
jgi:cytochrome c-type biogenesis protein CcsB